MNPRSAEESYCLHRAGQILDQARKISNADVFKTMIDQVLDHTNNALIYLKDLKEHGEFLGD